MNDVRELADYRPVIKGCDQKKLIYQAAEAVQQSPYVGGFVGTDFNLKLYIAGQSTEQPTTPWLGI